MRYGQSPEMPGNTTSTHSCLRFVLILAQCFGMLPVSGITSEDYSNLEFRWTSKRTIYSMVFAGLSALNTVFQALKIATVKLEFGLFVTLLFFACTFVTVVIFIDLGRKWPHLMKKWSELDVCMASYGFPKHLHRKMKIIAAVVMISAIVEHSLFIAFTWKYTKKYATLAETIHAYLESRYYHVFRVVPFSFPLGVLIQILNMFSTFAWNFMDLFVMIVSVALSSRFTQVVQRIAFLAKTKARDVQGWRQVREDYTRLTVLCVTLDEAVSNIILLSFANNLFVILVQLFNSLQPNRSKGVIDKIYFVYSFGFLIIRTVAVALYASTISSESKKPGHILTSLDYYVYNNEIERFIYQAKYDTSALTGHKLFRVTRELILNVAGAIVSYELILIQFDSY